MLNTPPGESSNSRSPREGRARGSSSVPVRTSRSRRGDRFEKNLPGFLSAARSNRLQEYGPVLRGRNPVRSPQAAHAPPTFFSFGQADVQAAGNLFPTVPSGSSLPQPPATVVPGEQLAAQVRGLEHMMHSAAAGFHADDDCVISTTAAVAYAEHGSVHAASAAVVETTVWECCSSAS